MAKKKRQYIARYEVTKVVEDGDSYIVNIKDGSPVILKKTLFDILISDKKKDGMQVQDAIRHTLSTKYLHDMGEYGLTIVELKSVAQGISILADNLLDDQIAKRFDCKGALTVMVEDLF